MNQYQEELLDHYRHPRNRGSLPDADFCSGEVNPSCGDSVEMCGIIKNGVMECVAFTGAGCVISQAAASMLTKLAQGKTLEHILKLNKENMLALVGIDLGPTRLKCALLPLFALQKGVQEFKSKQNA